MQKTASARAAKDTDWCMVQALLQLDSKQQRPCNTCNQGDMQFEANFFILSPTTSCHLAFYTGVTQIVALLPHSALLFAWRAQVTISTIDAIAATLFVQEGAGPATC